ncbi:MAG: AI-2E family transporter, partial [Frankiales bacterium]|nr:AI-2E family transporter [Frankiales bacterium]
MTGAASPDGPFLRASSAAWRLLVLVAAVALVAYLLLTLRLVVIPLMIGAAVAALLWRQVGWLSRRLPRNVAALLVTGGWLAGVVGALSLVATGVAGQSAELSDSVGGGLDRLRELLGGVGVDEARLAQLQESATTALTDNQD